MRLQIGWPLTEAEGIVIPKIHDDITFTFRKQAAFIRNLPNRTGSDTGGIEPLNGDSKSPEVIRLAITGHGIYRSLIK